MILFIVNERAGNGKGGRVWRKLERKLRESGVSYAVIAAEDADEARRLAAQRVAAGDVRSLAVVGGDGTLHALLPVAMNAGVPIGIVPAGSGNDTARAFGIPRRATDALAVILAGRAARVDLIRSQPLDPAPPAESGAAATPEHSLTALAIGLDAATALDVNVSRYKKWCNRLGVGSLAYVIGLLRALAKFRPVDVSLTVDGETHLFRHVWLVAATNVSTYGGGLRINPQASPTDGRVHLCVVHGCTAWQLIRLFPTILVGAHVRLPYVRQLAGRTVTIASGPDPMPVVGDGEPAGSSPQRIELLPGQLLFLTGCSG